MSSRVYLMTHGFPVPDQTAARTVSGPGQGQAVLDVRVHLRAFQRTQLKKHQYTLAQLPQRRAGGGGPRRVGGVQAGDVQAEAGDPTLRILALLAATNSATY